MIKELLKEAKKNNIELEIFKEREQNTSIETYNDKVDAFDSFDITSYSIKAIYGGKTINIETETIDNPNKIIELIKNQASIIDNNGEDSLSNNKDEIKSNSHNKEYNYQQIQKDMLSFADIKENYPCLVTVNCTFCSVNKQIGIYNTLDVKLEDTNSYVYYVAEIVLEFNGINKTNYKYIYAQDYDKDKFYDLVENLVKDTIDKESADSVKTNKYNIVLDNRCVAKLLNHFSSIYSAENINKNKSILTNKLNQKVFSDKITIVEDPQNNKYVGKRLFDDEGTKTYYKEIVKNGVFVTKLYDNKTAIKDNTKSTGNSFGTRNMYIVPGNTSKDELLKKLDNGIYINSIEGLHAGINNTTGDISLQSEGYTIKNGKKEKSLNMIILSTNIFELFNNVVDIGNDLEFENTQGGSPSLLINDITIAGNK